MSKENDISLWKITGDTFDPTKRNSDQHRSYLCVIYNAIYILITQNNNECLSEHDSTPLLEISSFAILNIIRVFWSLFFNPLPDDKILDWSKLKQIADILKCIYNEK